MHEVAILSYGGAQTLDIVGPMEVFAEASMFSGFAGIDPERHYRVRCVAPENHDPVMSNGLRVGADNVADIKPCFDTFIIPGGEETAMGELARNPDFMSWLHMAVSDSDRVVSVCTGAFILASLGVLDGRTVCTHWGACERLQEFAPAVHVDAESLFRKDGKFYTSAGVTSGIDLALALVEEDLGSGIAGSIARNLVLYLRRPGGQSQFRQPLKDQHRAGTRMREAIDYIRSHLHSPLPVEEIADAIAMSPRSFARLFKQELGVSPAAFVREQRLTLASSLLSDGDSNIKQIARATGFSTAAVLANAFKRRFGLSPDEYRARFRTTLAD